jgi:hypothetical protein
MKRTHDTLSSVGRKKKPAKRLQIKFDIELYERLEAYAAAHEMNITQALEQAARALFASEAATAAKKKRVDPGTDGECSGGRGAGARHGR